MAFIETGKLPDASYMSNATYRGHRDVSLGGLEQTRIDESRHYDSKQSIGRMRKQICVRNVGRRNLGCALYIKR